LETVARWRASAPAAFQFSLKAWQVITHPASSPTYKRTRLDAGDREHCGCFGFNPTVRWAWDETFAVAKELGVFLVLFQCPVSFRATKDNVARLRTFFERAKRGKFLMGWEPRGDWDSGLVSDLCRDLDLVHVIDPFQSEPSSRAKIQYFRLHGSAGSRHRFTSTEFDRLREFCRTRTPTYCLFNNVAMGPDAEKFARMITLKNR
jgi:uncharacterized protein YecE (DUF72 family)